MLKYRLVLGSEHLGARLWRLPPRSANTLHQHIRAEEFYFVLEGTGRMRVGDTTLTVPRHGAVLVGPRELRQVFKDTDADVLICHSRDGFDVNAPRAGFLPKLLLGLPASRPAGCCPGGL